MLHSVMDIFGAATVLFDRFPINYLLFLRINIVKVFMAIAVDCVVFIAGNEVVVFACLPACYGFYWGDSLLDREGIKL